MKKFKKWFKENKKIICLVLILLVVISLVSSSCNNSVFARLTDENTGAPVSIGEQAQGLLNNLLGGILNTASGTVLGAFSTLLFGLALIVFLVMWFIFAAVGVGDGWLSFPFPDQIIFNKMAFFDPNFINPTRQLSGQAPVAILQDIISSMYYTFFTVALTIFVIAAMVIGIKLALTSIASEKAQYKQALNNWVFGIVLLFSVHLLMAGIFAINEAVVEVAYHMSGNIKFSVSAFELVPGVGNTIKNIFGTVMSGINGILDILNVGFDLPEDALVELPWGGYAGMIIMFLVNAWGGDFISALTLFVVLGQTFALVVSYVKRLFFCIFLGMLAPIVIAVDVIKKSLS